MKRILGLFLLVILVLGLGSCANDFTIAEKLLKGDTAQVATPVFSVASGEVVSGTGVTISCDTEGAKIYYTTDGTAPTASSTEYIAAISVTEDVTLKAIAVKDGMNNSEVASVTYTIKQTVAKPTFSVPSGEVAKGTSITITCATEGAKIYYTTDGTAPTASSTEYTAAISVTPPLTIKAIAVKEGMNDSEIASVSYTILFSWYESPIDAETEEPATLASKYIWFGVFPKSVLAGNSTVTVDENTSVTIGGNTYYKGSDGEYYEKVTVNSYNSSDVYTDGSTASRNVIRYFKVEPITWKVLTTDYNNTGNALLVADDILTGNVKYYVNKSDRTINGSSVYPNNYKYSTIRAYLNGTYESDDTQEKTYEGKGFLQKAFTSTAQEKIIKTTVDNGGESTTDTSGAITKADGTGTTYTTDYTCEDTEDKIFLISEKEVTTSAYGFTAYNSYGIGNSRIKTTTDYAKANYAYRNTDTGKGGNWWLRSPIYMKDFARYVNDVGNPDDYGGVDTERYGVVPALSISLE